MGNCCSSCWPRKKTDPNRNNVDLEVVVKRSRTVPSTAQYVSKTGKTVVEILKAAAPLVPVPLIGQVLDVVLTLISICEQATALHGQIDVLKDQLCSLGVILVDAVEGEALPPATKTRITKLCDDLDRIKYDLEEILNQGNTVLGFFADTNKASVDDCVKRLNIAVTEFHVSHAITTEQDLHRMLQRLEDMSSQLKQANRGINEISRDVKNLMKNQQLHSASIISSGMPAQLADFRGRPGMIRDIGNLLCSDDPTKSRVAILATGGMGKTTVAVEMMENDIVKDKFGGNRFWVSCTGAKSFALFLGILKIRLQIKTDSGDVQNDIRNELTASKAPRLIVLDNFETPWDTSEKSDVESVLCSLARIHHVVLLITMRSNYPPSENIKWQVIELKPLDLGASREVYTEIDPSAEGHETLDELLNALGHMPYAVKLIATLGKKSAYRPDTLLNIWRERGPKTVGNEIDYSISLSVDSKFMQFHPEALSLFKTLSMLPEGATQDHIEKWWAVRLHSDLPLAISTLNDIALISRVEVPSDRPKYFVYPVVQSYMEHSGRISAQDRIDLQEAAFKFILDHKSSPGDPKFKGDLKAFATEDVNLQGILTFAAHQRMENHGQSNEIFDKTLLDALLTFSLYQLRSKPTLDIATLAVDVARKLDIKLHLAEGLNCLGRIRYHLSDYNGASSALEKARALFKYLPDPLRSAQTAYQLMTSYHLSSDTSAANALDKELQADLTALIADDERAITQVTIAMNLMENKCYKEALAYLSDSQKDFERTGRSVDRGECLQNLSECYAKLGRYPESMEAAQLAASESEYLGLDVDRNYVRGFECNLFLKLKNYNQALQVAETFLQESRRLGDVLGTARALEYIAQVFEQRGDVAAVRLGYESALEQYKIIGSGAQDQDGIRRCEFNLELLAQAIVEDEDDEGDIDSDGRHLMPQLEHLTFFRSDVSSIYSSDTGSGVAESTSSLSAS